MSTDPQKFAQSAHDAVALATLLADAVESGADWDEVWELARRRLEEQGDRLVMAQTHLWLQSLGTLRDVLNGLPDDVNIKGVTRPVSIADLLGGIAIDATRYEG